MAPQMLRRLSDKIVAAHKQACEENSMDVANILMQALELHISTIGGDSAENRTSMPEIEDAFELHESSK